ncbi:hypothetical protein [Janthinobacterium sp. CAN_S7]|uniref:hypothetical protein n=1 Tax=Janthinobacterium sp. CAN_S7 TaxID=3071704 RepID=UPI00319E058D
MTAIAQFDNDLGKYRVAFPNGETGEYVTLVEVALACDSNDWELLYKGKVKLLLAHRDAA